MNSTTPRRTSVVDNLVESIALSTAFMADEQNRKDAKEVNSTLAFCELAVSLPPEWFTPKERLMIVSLITMLYGNAHKFINDLDDGTVGFYNKCISDNVLPVEKAVDKIIQMHIQAFGGAI